MSIRPALLLRLGLPAAMVAATLVAVTGSSGTADVTAGPRPFKAKFHPDTQSGPAYDAKSVLVKFKPKATTSARKAALSKVKATPETSVSSDDVVTVTGDGKAADLLKKVKADPAVELASLNYLRHADATPNDYLYFNYQKYLPTVRVDQAWDLSKSAGTQTVAVLDTGVDAGHPDLVGHLLPGYNTFNTALAPNDVYGHGTMVTGIIAAGTGNGIGVAGVAWNAKVRPVKVLDDNGSGSDANLINGINWAVKNGVRVINMSLGGEGDNPLLHQAIQNAVNKGVVLVAAAGNTGASTPLHYPAAYPEVLSVGATNRNAVLTSFSTWGDSVDIAAPGYDITSTAPRAMTPAGYDPYLIGLAGTSFSSPIVAGVAALVRNKYPTLTPAQVMARLKATARDAGPRGDDPYYGAGVLDAYAALGGKWTTDFAGGAADGNDQPARATAVSSSISAAIDTEGDVDWYQAPGNGSSNLRVTVTGAMFDSGQYAQNFGPVVSVYDGDLRPLNVKANPEPPVDSDGYEIPQPLSVSVDVGVTPDPIYIAVRNANGSRDSRKYTLTVGTSNIGVAADGVPYPVRDVAPADRASGVPVATKPTVTFARVVDAATVTASTVRLVNGKSGASIGGTVAYDAATKQAVITPTAPLLDNTTYRIVVAGVNEGDGTTALVPFSSVFTTVDVAPQAVGSFDATGAYLAANLSWKVPPTTDIDQAIVRRNAGSKVPTIDTGVLVYAGTGAAVKNTGLLQGTTYTYAAWVKDRSGKVSPVATTQLLGMKSGIAVTSTLIKYGASITIKGSTLRIDNKAYAGLPVNIYARPKNVSTFKLLAALKTSSTGTISYVYKPAVSSVVMLTFPGNADLMGTRTADITVQMTPTISATLAPASIRLGQSTAFSGYVAPAHAGKVVYLQQYGNKVWKSIASVKLSTSGKYAFGIKPAIRGQIAYRVWFPADADHTQAYTVNKILTVS